MSASSTPSRLGKYEIRSTLGRGAMGIVYDGWDPIIHRRVAIKTVRLPDSQDQEAVEALDRFKREAQAAGRLTHPNIVGVFDYGETDEVAYIVMEFVEGRSLKDILDANLRIPPSDAIRIMQDVLAGLAYSHGRGVVHRDIKPANIMMTTENQAKIADFGIARIEASSMTQAGTVMGTPAYMSPEQFMGQVVDPRTDIYSCGIMLYQLLAGERPYEGSMTSIMHKAMTTIPPKPSELAVTAPRTLDPVVYRAMARRPEDRFPSAADFSAELTRAFLAPNPEPASDVDATIVSAPPSRPAAPPIAPAASPPAAGRAKPNRIPLIIAACVVLAAIGGGAAFFLRPTTPAQREASLTPSAPPSAPATERPAIPAAPTPSLPAIAAVPPVATPPPSALPPSTQATTPPPLPVEPIKPALEAPAVTTAPVIATPIAPPAIQTPAAPPAPAQQQAAIAPPLTPPVAAPPATPVMAAPPPDPATIPCSLIQISAAGTVALAGTQSESMVQQAAPGARPRLVDEPFCPVLDVLRALPNAGTAGTLALTQDGGPAPLHDNQIIALHATMPAFAGFLQVAYVQHDRTVEPLVPGPGYPAQTYPARGSIALGNPRRDSPGWLVGPPFGTDMIVAVVSTAPLFQPPLPSGQPLDAYLAALQTAIDALRRRGGTVAATALPIDTRPAH